MLPKITPATTNTAMSMAIILMIIAPLQKSLLLNNATDNIQHK